MNKVTCVLLDDDAVALAQLQKYVSQIPTVEVVGVFTEVMAAYQCLIEKPIDLLISDINMPMLDGLSFVRSLKNPPFVIFQTAHQQYAAASYEVEAIDFLTKPYSFDRLWQAIQRGQKRVAESKPTGDTTESYIFVKAEGGYLRFLFEEIRYIESYQNYVKVFSTTDMVVVRMSMRKVEEQFPPQFVRIHRTLIVNMKYISMVKQDEVILIDGTSLILGRHFYEEVKEKVVNQHLLKG